MAKEKDDPVRDAAGAAFRGNVKTGRLATADGQEIAYDHYINGKDKVVVIVHGFFNSKSSELLAGFARHLSRMYDIFIFDLRGHGSSSGRFTWTSREGNDLEAALGFVDGKYRKIGVIGFSMGASISINVLSKGRYKVDSLVCVSALSDQSKVDYRWWRLDPENDIVYSLFSSGGRKGKGVRPGWVWHKKEKPVDTAGRLKMPVLYIHGEKDWVVDRRHSERLFDESVSKKAMKIIAGGPHAEYLLRKNGEEFIGQVDEWLAVTMR